MSRSSITSEKARARVVVFPVPTRGCCQRVRTARRGLTARQWITLLRELMQVPDPRGRRGRRHSLQSVLLIAICAVLAGARSFAAIGDRSAIHRPALGVCGDLPHAATIRRVLMAVDPVVGEAAVTRWALARRDG